MHVARAGIELPLATPVAIRWTVYTSTAARNLTEVSILLIYEIAAVCCTCCFMTLKKQGRINVATPSSQVTIPYKHGDLHSSSEMLNPASP